MKIGIATPFSVVNYGTKLQAYAVQMAIEDIVGSTNVEIINYHHSSDRRVLLLLKKALSVKGMKDRIAYRKMQKVLIENVGEKNVAERKRAVNSFDRLYKLSQKINGFNNLVQYAKQYDTVVCGSDQIWIPANLKTQFFTLDFYSGKKIAYAASFGVESIAPRVQKKYRDFLTKFAAISVRENSGAVIVNSLLPDSGVQLVCDPTLLHDASKWNTVADLSEMNTEERYVLCYFLGTNPSHRKAVKEYAKKHNLKIKAFSHFKGWVDADKDFADEELFAATPNDFLKLIRDAECVCTDSMHATVFSLIYNTKFFTFERYANTDSDSRNTRIESLLSRTGMQNRLIHSAAEIKIEDTDDVRWEQVNEKLCNLRADSWKFLKEALDGND